MAAARDGHYRSTCARAGGIDYATLKRWFKRAKDDPAFARFEQDFLQAEHEGEIAALAAIKGAGAADWRAWAWYLERRYPDRWGRREHLTAKIAAGDAPPGTRNDILARIEAEIAKREQQTDDD